MDGLNYWSRTLQRRVARRRALLAGGAGVAGAALLAACGGGGDEDEGASTGVKGDTSGLVSARVDSFKQAVKGGTLKFSVTADIPNFDGHFLSFADAQQVLLNYNRLMRVKPGTLQLSDGTIVGDLAESSEFSPDKLTLTLKLRANAGMPQVAPVNGRNLDSGDVTYSWERWKKNGTNRSELANDINPNSPILSVTATDTKTVVIKLKEPVASILANLANQASGWWFIFPKEADSGIDLRRNPMGGGPYYISEYVPSSRFVYSRNPNYFDKNTAFADKIEVPIVSEYATGLAQIKAGNLHSYAVTADDVIPTKKDVPDLGMYQTDLAAFGVSTFFGFQPTEKTPFRDVRLRQAWSMSLDRDLFNDTFGNVSKFSAQGVPVESVWNTAILATAFKGWWQDPKGKDFGANASYYQKNIAEAKKLLAAANYASGITVISNQIGGAEYGPTYAKYIDVMEGMASEAGFKVTKALQGYATNWMPEFRDGHGYFDGVAYRLTPQATDPGDQLYSEYNKGGAIYYGFDDQGKGTPKGQPFTGDPTVNDLTQKIRTEFDDGKRKSYAADLQRYLAKQQYFITYLGSATGFNLAWPTVKNWRVLSTPDFGQLWSSYWLDGTLPPNKKS